MELSRAELKAAAEWLVRLREETASAADHEAFEAWRNADARHEAAFGRVAGGMDDMIAAELLRRAPRRDQPRRERRALIAAGIAAGALVAAVGFAVTAPQSYATAIGEQRTVTLADGGVIVLNTDTRVAVQFAQHVRRVRLERGEAFFDVAHDAVRPFIVETPQYRVEALGTQFAVRLVPGATGVLVADGAVIVKHTGEPSPARRIGAGQELERAGATWRVASVQAPEIERRLAWRTGWLEFTGQPLSAAVDEVARYTGALFTIDDPQVRDMPVTVRFRANDLDRFIYGVELGLEFAEIEASVERNADEVRIVRRDALAE